MNGGQYKGAKLVSANGELRVLRAVKVAVRGGAGAASPVEREIARGEVRPQVWSPLGEQGYLDWETAIGPSRAGTERRRGGLCSWCLNGAAHLWAGILNRSQWSRGKVYGNHGEYERKNQV